MADRQDVFRNYGFFLELKGERAAYFTKATGLGAEVESIEYREGGHPSTVYKLPGRTKISDVELSYGVTQSDVLWRWLDSAIQGRVERSNVSVVVLGSDGKTEVTRWNLGNAWLRACEVADFDALGNDVLIERMTLAAERWSAAAAAVGEIASLLRRLLVGVLLGWVERLESSMPPRIRRGRGRASRCARALARAPASGRAAYFHPARRRTACAVRRRRRACTRGRRVACACPGDWRRAVRTRARSPAVSAHTTVPATPDSAAPADSGARGENGHTTPEGAWTARCGGCNEATLSNTYARAHARRARGTVAHGWTRRAVRDARGAARGAVAARRRARR